MRVAVFGAGRVGSAIARRLLAGGNEVDVVDVGEPAEVQRRLDHVVPGARARSPEDAVALADVVVVAVPLRRFRDISADLLAGSIVVDVMNYWKLADGIVPEFEGAVSTEIVAAHFRDSSVVRTLNHLGWQDIEDDAGLSPRRALAVASDDADAARVVCEMVESMGFDAVPSGPLATARAFQVGSDIFEGSYTRDELFRELDAALGREE